MDMTKPSFESLADPAAAGATGALVAGCCAAAVPSGVAVGASGWLQAASASSDTGRIKRK